MERRGELRARLKRWEVEFVRERGRRPSQADVEEAPEEIRGLYREYGRLKRSGQPPDPPSEQDSGCWGAHLNRRPKGPEGAGERDPLRASAQYFGMKLKSNLGDAIKVQDRGGNSREIPTWSDLWAKRTENRPWFYPPLQERPPVPRRTLAPRPPAVPKPEGGDKDPFPTGSRDDPELLLPPSVSALAPVVLSAKAGLQVNKFQRLQRTLARRLGSLDPGWLRRCQEEHGETPERGDPAPEPGSGAGARRERIPDALPGASRLDAEGIGRREGEEVPEGIPGSALESRRSPRDLARNGEREAAGAAPPEREAAARSGEARASRKRLREAGMGGHGAVSKRSRNDKEEDEEAAMEVPVPMENLLGEVEEEEGRGRSSRKAPAPRKEGNFVRLNLRKKCYARGPASKGRHLRKQLWKQKWRKKAEQFGGGGGARDGRSDVCFRCGTAGHWAAACPGRAQQRAPVEDEAEEEAPLAVPEPPPLSVRPLLSEPPAPPLPVEPLYRAGPDGQLPETPAEVLAALSELGFSAFRPGQEVAVMRILSGLSTLVVLPTGTGKSLCYQLPAYLYRKRSPCVTLVVSPLVSLMDDQVSALPAALRAVCIHSNMSRAQRDAALEQVRTGSAHVLLLSPEAVAGGGGGSSCLPGAERLPPVAFACIDEAHCVSQWSHNFRPSYLRLCKVLRDRLGVRCFLGLTATATRGTARDVCRHLGVPAGAGAAVRSAAVPPNLHLSVSMDSDRDQALISLLQGERFGSLRSVIVYCTRREETARVAALIRTRLHGAPLPEPARGHGKEERARKSGRLEWLAAAYHAGLSPGERRRVQGAFMRGHLRVVVATVAFGMGLDKADVRGVVHYNMPKSFESYVQEIGRAGRDGHPAHCHLFLDPEGGDLHELRRHIHGDTVDYFTVKKLVQRVFSPCKCRELHGSQEDGAGATEVEGAEVAEEEQDGDVAPSSPPPQQRVCYKHERALPIEELVEALDLREEAIETLLCYLELHPRRWLELLPLTRASCRVRCAGGPRHLRAAAASSPALAAALAGRDAPGDSVEFDVVALSDRMGWEAPLVKRALRQLQWDPRLRPGTGGLHVEFGGLSFHVRAYGDLGPRELDAACAFLHGRAAARERAALAQLRACFRAFRSVAAETCAPQPAAAQDERSARLKALLRDYFEEDPDGAETERGGDAEERDGDAEERAREDAKLHEWESQIRADIRHFLSIRHDERFTGRAVARVFHGIGSPCFPAQVYGRDRRFWRRHLSVDFHALARLATDEILKSR